MTQHYLVGELSLRLAQLDDVAGQSLEDAISQLRQEAECVPFDELSRPLLQALTLGDRLCWDSLGRGDAIAFSNQAGICEDLYDFGAFANLL